MNDAWNNWLAAVPPEQLSSLIHTLQQKGLIPPSSNGHSVAPTGDKKDIPIICTPANELFAQEVPRFVDTFGLMPEFQKLAFEEHGNLLIKGPKGNGKSMSIRAFAAANRVPLVVVECSENTKDLHLLGRYVMVGRETAFVLAGIAKAIKTANEVGSCVLLLEEFNALTPQSQKLLNGALQERAVEVEALGKTFRLTSGAKIWFTGTMNPSVYGGTYDLNEDLKSRMGEIEIGYPSFAHEKQIIKANIQGFSPAVPDDVIDLLLRFAQETRQQSMGYALSTRDLVRAVHTIRTNSLPKALQMLVCKFEGEERTTAITRLHSHFASVQVKNTWGA